MKKIILLLVLVTICVLIFIQRSLEITDKKDVFENLLSEVYDENGRNKTDGENNAVTDNTVPYEIATSEGIEVGGMILDDITLKVAIKTSGFTGYYHETADISSDSGMTVTMGGADARYQAGEHFSVSTEDVKTAGDIRIAPDNSGKLIINSITRGYGAPCYRGTLTLSSYKSGIILINELNVGEYLYSVIPSEMPVSYGKEALKAQAVCARSYAYIHILQGGVDELGGRADVDDSTAYQVYNNSPETPESIAAVSETAGQVLIYEGQVVSAYYYSTSCGHSADGSEVWFGMKSVPYLVGRLQTLEGNELGEMSDLSVDENFKAFLDNRELKTYDSGFPWYRWRVSVPYEKIRESVEHSLQSRYEINPSLILTKKGRRYVSEPVSSIGDIKSVRVVKRGKGGIVTELLIKGSEKTILVKTEYNIRLLLAPAGEKIYRVDGSIVDGMPILPSAFFVVTSSKTESGRVLDFYGGGYGHGVGMSQNGAKALSDAGYSYTDILGFYFRGCIAGRL